jgi:hypothetical protein
VGCSWVLKCVGVELGVELCVVQLGVELCGMNLCVEMCGGAVGC